MKKLTSILFAIFLSVTLLAGSMKLSDGNVIMWQSETTRIQYESYRVEIKLYQTSEFNVWGTVTLGDQTKNFLIYAGETSTFVNFENLTNGRFYQITIKVNNK